MSKPSQQKARQWNTDSKQVGCRMWLLQNQLFTLQSDRESAAAGREQEADLVAAEVDAAQQRLASLEAEKGALQAQVLFWLRR